LNLSNEDAAHGVGDEMDGFGIFGLFDNTATNVVRERFDGVVAGVVAEVDDPVVFRLQRLGQ
jgi:hypothetical protein